MPRSRDYNHQSIGLPRMHDVRRSFTAADRLLRGKRRIKHQVPREVNDLGAFRTQHIVVSRKACKQSPVSKPPTQDHIYELARNFITADCRPLEIWDGRRSLWDESLPILDDLHALRDRSERLCVFG
jgi:hypothetical protein